MTKTKETNAKVEDSKQDNEQFNLDGILSELGSFGKYQLFLLFLLSFRDSFLAMCNFNYVFTSNMVDFRCVVPECESMGPSYNTSWMSFALPNETNVCRRMAPYHPLEYNTTEPYQSLCVPDNFSKNITTPCDRVVYADHNSVVAEFDLGCQPWKATLIGTIHNLGLVISFVLSGLVSDRYGRKVIIVGTPLVVGIVGIVKSFSVNYWMLLVLEFLETALGYGNASLVLSLEAVTQKRRVVFSCISDMLGNIGFACFGLIAWKFPYWRHMMRAIYTPLLIAVFYIFLVDEGVRWLLAHNKKDEAVRVLNKVAKYNNIELSRKAKEMLNSIAEERDDTPGEEAQKPAVVRSQLLTDLRSRKILLRILLLAICFFCCFFIYSGALINSTTVSGDKYLNFSILVLAAVPTRIITALTLTRFGRKAPICIAYFVCCVAFIASAFVPKYIAMMFYLVGKMSSSYGIFSISVVAIEVFPTTSRNSLTNIATTIGRLGSVLTAQTPLLSELNSHSDIHLPSLVFGLVALVPGILALFLPDASKTCLPEDLQEAEKLDQVEPSDNESRRSVSISNYEKDTKDIFRHRISTIEDEKE